MPKKDSEFYLRMLEAKARKQKHLEQVRLAAEFQVHPERFIEPVKTQAEQKMDIAFNQLKTKLLIEQPGYKDQLERAIQHLHDKTQGI